MPVTIRSRGAAGARTVTSTLREPAAAEQEVAGPNGELQRLGVAVDVALSESSSRRVETLRTTTVRVACQRGPPQSPKPSVAGDVATSPTAAAPSRKIPFPTASADARPRCA